MFKKGEVVKVLVATLSVGLTVAAVTSLMFYGQNFQPAILWVLIAATVVSYLNLAINIDNSENGRMLGYMLNAAFATSLPIVYWVVVGLSH